MIGSVKGELLLVALICTVAVSLPFVAHGFQIPLHAIPLFAIWMDGK